MNRIRTHHLPPAVARTLKGFHRVTRLYALARVLCGAGLLYLILALVAMHLDRVFFLAPQARVALSWGAHGVVAAYLLAGLLVFALRGPSLRRIAYDLGRRLPGGDGERYVTMDSVLGEAAGTPHDPVREELVGHLRHATEELSRGARPGRLVRDRLLVRRALGLLAAALVCGTLALLPDYQFPLMARRFLQPSANLPKPSFIRLRVTPETLVLGKGEEAVIQASIEGEIPPLLAGLYRLAGLDTRRCLMATAPGRPADVRVNPATARELTRVQRRLFVFSQSEVAEGFGYRLRCGDAETAVHLVDVVVPPRIVEMRLVATPPAYTKRPPVELVNPQQPVPLFPGTRVELRFTVDQDTPERELLIGGRPGPALEWDAGARAGRHAFVMKDKAELEVRVRNARGFANKERARVSLVRLDDRPPVVRVQYPAGDLTVAPGELIPVQALAEDDLEVAAAAFRFQLNPDLNPDAALQELPVALPEPHGTQAALNEAFDLEQTKAGPGDDLLLLVRVRDSAGNDAEARPIRIRVKAFTRGENERRRLLALQTVRELLEGLAARPPAAAAPELDRAVYAEALKVAAGRGVPLAEAPAMESVLRLLETEHHFTDAPRHKDDARRLSAVLAAAWALGEWPGRPSTAAAAEPWPEVLARDAVAPLLRSRRLQNVTWRLFGMRGEVAGMRQRLSGPLAPVGEAAGRRATPESVVLEALAAVEARPEVRSARQAETTLHRRIAEIEARAQAAPPPEGEAVENPFAPLKLDSEVKRLAPEDAKLLEDLRKQLKAATVERRRVAGAALGEAVTAGVAALKQAGTLADPKAIEAWAAAAFERLARPGEPEADAARRLAIVRQAAGSGQAGPGPADGTTAEDKSLNRRAELLLVALEEIGVDLMSVAGGTSALDEAALKELQGELNTAGYYLKRGDRARKREACEDVERVLHKMLQTVRPALPRALADEQRARERLRAAYDAAWERMATVAPPRKGATPSTRLAKSWAEADLRMLEGDPFAPLAPRLRDMALLDALDDAPAGSGSAPSGFLVMTGAVATAAAGEWRAGQLLALDCEWGDIRDSRRLADSEKAMAAAVLGLTAAQLGALPGIRPESLESGLMAVPLDGSAPVPTRLAPVAAALGELEADAAERLLLEAAAARLPLGRPLEWAGRALDAAEAALREVEALEAAQAGAAAEAPARIGRALEAIDRALTRYDQLARLAALDTGWVDPCAGTAVREERLFLKVREAVGRYRGRAAMAQESIAALRDRTIDAAQLGALGGDVAIVKAGIGALHTTLKAAVDGYAAAEAGPAYPIQTLFADTRDRVAAGREMAAGANQGDVVKRFVARFPEAGLAYLGLRCGTLETAATELRALVERAEAGGGVAAGDAPVLAALRAGISGFQEALDRAGGIARLERTRQDTAALRSRVEVLAGVTPAAGDAPAQRRRLLELAATLKDTQRLLGRARAEIDFAAEPPIEYAGGPDGIWRPETRMDAELARQRLLGQLRMAGQRFDLGMLGAFDAPLDAGACRELRAWSLLSHRVARSPLSGAVTPPRTEAGGEAVRNPLVKWLLDQLQEAAGETRSEDSLRHYPGIARELIQSLKDFVRY